MSTLIPTATLPRQYNRKHDLLIGYSCNGSEPTTWAVALAEFLRSGGTLQVIVANGTGEIAGDCHRDMTTGCWEGGHEMMEVSTYDWCFWNDDDEEPCWDWDEEPSSVEMVPENEL